MSGLCCNSARKPSGVRRGRLRPAEDQYSRVQLTARPASISTPLLSRTYTVSLYSGSSVSAAVPGRYLWIYPHCLPRCPAVLPGSTPVWPIRAFLCNVHILTDDTQSLHTGGHHHVVLSRPQRTCCDRSEQWHLLLVTPSVISGYTSSIAMWYWKWIKHQSPELGECVSVSVWIWGVWWHWVKIVVKQLWSVGARVSECKCECRSQSLPMTEQQQCINVDHLGTSSHN